MLLFVYITVTSSLFHIEADTKVHRFEGRVDTMDRAGAMYASMSIVLLFAHIPVQVAELILELLFIPVAALFAVYMPESTLWVYFCLPVFVLLLIVPPLDILYGPPPARRPWLVAGVVFSLVGVGLYAGNNSEQNLVWHGMWHLTSALGASCLIYALRDPNLLTGYVMLEDILPVH